MGNRKVGTPSGGQKLNRNASDWQVIQSLFDELRPLRASFFGALILYFPVAFFAVAQPMIIGAAVQYGFRTKDFHQVLLWTGIFVLAIIMHASSEMLQHFLMQRAGQGLVKGLRTKMFSKIQRLPVQYFDHTPLGRILTRVTNDVESIADLFSSGAVQIFGDLLFLVGTFIMLYIVNVRLALSTLVVLPILVLGLSFFRRWTRDAYHRAGKVLARVNGYSQE